MSTDNEMMNILRNLDAVGTNKPNVNPATGVQSDTPKANDAKAMMAILENFNKVDPNGSALVPEGKLGAEQKRVGQVGAQETPSGEGHPFRRKLVGDSVENNDEVVAEDDLEEGRGKTIYDVMQTSIDDDEGRSMDVFQVIDQDENVISTHRSVNAADAKARRLNKKVSMGEDTIGKKQKLSDVLRSMEESEDEIANRLTKEFHSKSEPKKAPIKADNGKLSLAELKHGILTKLAEVARQVKASDDAELLESLNENFIKRF